MSWLGRRPSRMYTPRSAASLTASKYQDSFHIASAPGACRPSSSGSGRSAGGRPCRGSGSSDSASRSRICCAWRAKVAMNMSSPRSVRWTTIEAATAMTIPPKVWRRYSSQQRSHERSSTPWARSSEWYSRTRSSSWARRSSSRSPPPTKYAASYSAGPHDDRLPVDDPAPTVPEEQVVQPVVAVHEPERRPAVLAPGVEARHEALGDRRVLGRDAVAVALEEAGQQLGQQRLVQGVGLVEPVGRAEREVVEHRGVDVRERAQRDRGLVHAASGDLVALARAGDVLEDQREPALGRVELGQQAPHDRLADPRREMPVERDLAQVRAHAHAGRAARRVGRRELDHHRLVAEGHAVALAHLAGADRVDGVQFEPAAAKRRGEPFRSDLVSGPDEHDAILAG